MTTLTDWIDEAAEKYEWDHAEELGDGPSFKAGARAAIEKLSAMGEDSFDKGAFDKWTTGITDNDWGRVGYNGMLEHAARSQHAKLSALIAARDARLAKAEALLREIHEREFVHYAGDFVLEKVDKYFNEQQHNIGEMK